MIKRAYKRIDFVFISQVYMNIYKISRKTICKYL